MISEVKNMDCIEYMQHFPDNYFELAIVDPPYGIGISGQKENKKGKKSDRKYHQQKNWDKETPTKEYFNELERVSKNQIIWGGNYFVKHLHKGKKGWIVWDKCQHGLTMSDCELAYSSFDVPTRIYYKNRAILISQNTIHPTEKPIHLYRWLLQNYAKPNDKILDTHLGSGSSRIAADMEGFDFYACELDKDYFDMSCKRFDEYKQQLKLL